MLHDTFHRPDAPAARVVNTVVWILILLFMLLTGPVTVHALAKTAFRLGLKPVLAEDQDHDD